MSTIPVHATGSVAVAARHTLLTRRDRELVEVHGIEDADAGGARRAPHTLAELEAVAGELLNDLSFTLRAIGQLKTSHREEMAAEHNRLITQLCWRWARLLGRNPPAPPPPDPCESQAYQYLALLIDWAKAATPVAPPRAGDNTLSPPRGDDTGAADPSEVRSGSAVATAAAAAPVKPQAIELSARELTAKLGLGDKLRNAVACFLGRYANIHPSAKVDVQRARRGEARVRYRVNLVWLPLLEQLDGWRKTATIDNSATVDDDSAV